MWISVDETTDAERRHVAAVVVRTLEDEPTRPYILTAVELSHTNARKVLEAVDDSIRMLGDAVTRNDVLAFVTDSAPYMIKCGKII